MEKVQSRGPRYQMNTLAGNEVWLLRQVKSANFLNSSQCGDNGLQSSVHNFVPCPYHGSLNPLCQQAELSYDMLACLSNYCPCSFPSSETRKMVLRGRAILEPEALGWGCWKSDCIIPMIASCAWQARYRIERFITMTSIHYVLVREKRRRLLWTSIPAQPH